jgi:S1-C subfamily serine protease
MKLLRIPLALVVVAALAGAPRASAQEFDPADLYEKCVGSAVYIVTPLRDGISMGSGSLIDAEKRYIITNSHVVHDADWVYVQFPVRNKDGSLMTDKKKYMERIPAGQAIKGKVLHRDQSRDLALVQLSSLPPGAKAIPLSKHSPRRGEKVINIGNPGKVDSTFSMTEGNVRAVDIRDFAVGGSDGVMRIKARMVTATNPVNPGDSGGPLIDKRGYQVAVTESGVFDGKTQNVNGFVDVTEVRAFLAEKKITIKELSEETDAAATTPKAGPGAIVPKKDMLTTTPKKDATATTTAPEKKTDPAPGAGTATATGPTAEDEKAAALALSRARLFSNSDDDRPTYINKLKEVVAKFPGTAAAKDAQKKLDALK